MSTNQPNSLSGDSNPPSQASDLLLEEFFATQRAIYRTWAWRQIRPIYLLTSTEKVMSALRITSLYRSLTQPEETNSSST